jgi:hypothetical protein
MTYDKTRRLGRIGALTLFGLILSVNTAHAQLLGATVNVSANYPDVSSLSSDGGNATVSNAIEYPSGTFSSYNSSWSVDVTDNQLIITNAGASTGFPFASATFNGFVLKVLSGPTLAWAHVAPASNFFPIGIAIVGGNELQLDFQGVTAQNFTPLSSVIDIGFTNPVPEPETYAMMMAGLGLMGAVARRRKVKQQ